MNKEEEACSRSEHMFDKVVTPSDVGKLNRLVIPKQHAERYFPLDHNSPNKGLLLSFEDIKGNSSTSTTWRFRYSYWNSSQSYVMTKGWSRFVKDKSLVAGDIVSFSRDSCNQEKLYIDWRRRPKMMMIQDQDHHLYNHFSRGSMLMMMPRFYSFPRHNLDVGYYVRDPTAVIESVPLLMMNQTRAHVASIGGGGGKRLRLFGVDIMESSSSSSCGCVPRGNVSMGGSLLKMRLVNDDESLVAMENESVIEDHFFTKKGKSSLSFDLDK